jgi:nitroreductase
MEFFEAVAARYCHKVAFNPNIPVPDDDLVKITQAGMAAPSASNGQSPEFILVNDKAIIKQVGEITKHVPLSTAPAYIVLVEPLSEGGQGIPCYLEDYAAATTQMLLAATALGYSCGWVDGIFQDLALRSPVSELLQIPEDRRLMVIIPVGKPGEPGPRRTKKPFERRASWNRYAVIR